MFKEETKKPKPGTFQEAADALRKQLNPSKRKENNVWGKQSSAQGSAANKDHTGLLKLKKLSLR